jgi:hypothetical protein
MPPVHAPLFTPTQATALLDQVIYERVLDCVDLDGLYELAQSLTFLVGDLHGMPADQVDELARAMFERALLRLPDDIRRYLRTGPSISFGSFGPPIPLPRCEEPRVHRADPGAGCDATHVDRLDPDRHDRETRVARAGSDPHGAETRVDRPPARRPPPPPRRLSS